MSVYGPPETLERETMMFRSALELSFQLSASAVEETGDAVRPEGAEGATVTYDHLIASAMTTVPVNTSSMIVDTGPALKLNCESAFQAPPLTRWSTSIVVWPSAL